MSEVTNIGTESYDAFDAAWDDDSTLTADTETVEEDADISTENEADEADQPEAENDVQTEQGAEAEGQAEPEADQPQESRYTLKHFDETREVGLNEMMSLAQKGMDYDRVKGKRDTLMGDNEALSKRVAELEPLAKFLDEVCAEAGMDRQDFIDHARANRLVDSEKAKGRELSPELALELIQKQKAEAPKTAEPPKTAEQQEEPKHESDAEARKKDEFVAFYVAHPDVDPSDIPQEVWDSWQKNGDLDGAYTRYENKKLKEENAVLKQNKKNRERSTGSQKSSGAGTTRDSFDIGWDSV